MKNEYAIVVKLLSKHDFWYDKSDDHQAWLAGHYSEKQLFYVLNSIPKEDAEKLWKQYAPQELENHFKYEGDLC